MAAAVLAAAPIIAAAGASNISYAEAFPDTNFRGAVLDLLNADGGGRTGASLVSDSDKAILAAQTALNVSYRNIADLSGIAYFSGLTRLNCDGNRPLTALDASQNTALVELYCHYNDNLAAINVQGLTMLEKLYCYNSKLQALDVTKNPSLKVLYCSTNQLTTLDVSQNSALLELNCAETNIKNLDVSKNTALTFLACWNSPLTALDVSNNIELKELHCGRYDGGEGLLQALDVTKNTKLTYLQCWGELTVLDLSRNTELTRLHCGGNKLAALDLSNNIKLEEVYCGDNKLTALDVSKNTALTSLYCGGNELTALDISKNTALVLLSCGNNKLSALNVTGANELAYLWCSDNQLTSIATPDIPKLVQLYCQRNQLTALDMSKHTEMDWLFCYSNQLKELDVAQCTKMRRFFCYDNQLSALDVSKNIALTWLQCQTNNLTALDVSQNTALTDLYCNDNYLASPDDVKGWQTTGRLVINSPTNPESGTFRFYNQKTVVTKPVITITTQPVPHLIINVVDGLVQGDNILTIEAVVTPTGTPTYTWYQQIDGINDLVVGTGSSFAIIPPYSVLSKEYYYYCIVYSLGADSVKSNVANVTVAVLLNRPGIEILTQPATATTITEGNISGSLSMTAVLRPSGGVPDYQWYSNTSAVNSGGAPIAGATSSTFTIPTNLKAAGSPYYYYCVASGPGVMSIASNVATVTVNPPANYNYYIYLTPEKTTIKAGETLYVDVMLLGSINYTQMAAEIIYDANLLEFKGYDNLQGWAASVTKSAADKVAVRSVPSMSMVVGAPCTPAIRIVRLIFTAKDGFTGESINTSLSFASTLVSPAGGVVGTTVDPGKPLSITLQK